MMILFIVLNKYNDIWVVAKLSTTQSKVANEKNIFITITIMIAESNPREKNIMVSDEYITREKLIIKQH